ncbi:MDR family MFS transporter [Polycladospora coralii]|uniref:MDR family MFS transporter n=1 Tax=Polycladospora coralii TaxID=2771432 RepID=UPI003D2FE875
MQKDVSKKRIVMIVYVLAMFMAALDATITNVALPSIGATFQVPPAATGAINVGYLVSLAMFLPVSGWLGDRFGTKRVFLFSLMTFTIASLLCAVAPNLFMLNVFRVIQGAGGGLLTPVGMAILFRTFSPAERPKIARMLVLPIAVAPALGPIVGGILVDSLSWRWIFYINLPIGLLAIFIGLLFLHEHVEEKPGRFDIKGFLLSVPGFSMLIYALTQGASKGWNAPEVVITGVIGLILMVVLCVVEWNTSEPMLNLRLFKDPVFRNMCMISFCSAAALFGMLYVFPLMYQNALQASATDTGLTTFPEALGLMLSSQMLPHSLKRLGVKRLMIVSLIGSIVVFTLIAISVSANPWFIRFLMFNVGIFLGHAVGAVQATAFHNISLSSMGRATTLFQVQNRLGSVVGVAILASVMGVMEGQVGSQQIDLMTYQWSLFGSAIFLSLALVVAINLKQLDTVPTKAMPVKAPAKAN